MNDKSVHYSVVEIALHMDNRHTGGGFSNMICSRTKKCTKLSVICHHLVERAEKRTKYG